jgi:hypothetical protein
MPRLLTRHLAISPSNPISVKFFPLPQRLENGQMVSCGKPLTVGIGNDGRALAEATARTHLSQLLGREHGIG